MIAAGHSGQTARTMKGRDYISIGHRVRIARTELVFRFSRSGGHGGQNVNKLETKVDLSFDVAHSPSLSDTQRARILDRLRSRIDRAGILHITAQDSRSQWQNREKAVMRLAELLKKALAPERKRIATGVPAASRQRRLDEKKRRGEIKRLRRFREE